MPQVDTATPTAPIALDAYEQLADAYAERIDTKPHNAYLERPATLGLLPDVADKRVLDAGCGPGIYTEWLVDHGAEVVGVDVSPKMVERARERVGDKARIEQADLGSDLDRFDDAGFDLVVSSLVLDYVRDVASGFRQFRRLCRPDGHLVFSVLHPLAAHLLFEPSDYFATEEVSSQWTGFGTPVVVPSYRRPLSAWTEALASAGFVIERMVEARPTEKFRAQAPEQYQELRRRPSFLCVRACKTSPIRRRTATSPHS
ncbi:MAG: class I SAM-dependent methyltransferase [Myxococcota bacterium]